MNCIAQAFAQILSFAKSFLKHKQTQSLQRKTGHSKNHPSNCADNNVAASKQQFMSTRTSRRVASPLVNKDVIVSILGHHDFTNKTESEDDWVLSIQDFRQQLEVIRERNLTVISMPQFLDWKEGIAPWPCEHCVMITVDDGFETLYTLALPVLVEFAYPFTFFACSDACSDPGREMENALSTAQIREMLTLHGTILASHTISHPH